MNFHCSNGWAHETSSPVLVAWQREGQKWPTRLREALAEKRRVNGCLMNTTSWLANKVVSLYTQGFFFFLRGGIWNNVCFHCYSLSRLSIPFQLKEWDGHGRIHVLPDWWSGPGEQGNIKLIAFLSGSASSLSYLSLYYFTLQLENPDPSWLSDKAWDELCRMCDLHGFKDFRFVNFFHYTLLGFLIKKLMAWNDK